MSSLIVDIDVGGKKFRASLASLNRSPFLQPLLRCSQQDGTVPAARTGDGLVFVDRSPELFESVLDVLRSDGDTDLCASSPEEAVRLKREFEYYGLEASLSEDGEEQVVVSARFLSGKLDLHVSAVSSLHAELGSGIEARFPTFVNLAGVPDGLGHHRRYNENNVQASDIPRYMAGIADQLVSMGFFEDRRSESSSLSFAPRHWVEHVVSRLDLAGVAGEDIEWMAYDKARWHWVSETVTYTRRKRSVLHVKSPRAYFSDGDNQAPTRSVHVSSDLGHTVPQISACPSAPCEGTSALGATDDVRTPMHQVDTACLSGGAHVASPPVSDEPLHQEVVAVTKEAEASHVAAELRTPGVEPLAHPALALASSTQPGDEQEKLAEDANADIAQAIMESRSTSPLEGVPLSDDGVVVLRLMRRARSQAVAEVLSGSPLLEACHARVAEAGGCQWSPAWLFVPITQDQIREGGLELKDHHIVCLKDDVEKIRAALKGIRCTDRPGLAPPADADAEHIAVEVEQYCTLRTFSSFGTPPS